MKIESRVEALEHELKILRNEIQSTLLEIREQVLNHYYPELRAEEPQRPKLDAPRGNEVRVSELRPGKANPSKSSGNSRTQTLITPDPPKPVNPFSDLSLQDMDVNDLDNLDTDEIDNAYLGEDLDSELDEDVDEELGIGVSLSTRSNPFAPQMREVRLQQLKQPPVPKGKQNAVRSEPQGTKQNRRNFAALAAWVGDSVGKVGKERTVQVVETYVASGGTLSNETKRSILQMVALAGDAEPTSPVGNQEMLGIMVELDQILGEQ